MKCVHYRNPDKGPCFPPHQGGDAQHLLVDPELEGKFPVASFCTGHLQRLKSFIMKGVCNDAGIGMLVDDDGMAHIDPERSREWEAESEADC